MPYDEVVFSDMDRLLRPSEVARLFAVSPKTVARWARDEKLPSVVTAGGQRRFRAREIARLLREDGGAA